MPAPLILIVEDHEMSRRLLRDVLVLEGYATIEAETAEAALDLARTRAPALILMDVRLPEMTGFAALREIRADPRIRHVPIIAVTASAMPMERAEILAAGFDGYMAKPLDVDQFVVEVRAVLGAHERP